MPSRKKTSSYYSQFEPDSGQMNYDDMFAALTPSGDTPKSGAKRRLTALPQLSERYVDELLYRSRTKPLPPLPPERSSQQKGKTKPVPRPVSGSWVGMFRWMKTQAANHTASSPDDSPRPHARYVSALRIALNRASDRKTSQSNDVSRKNSDRSERSERVPSRTKHYAPPPWSVKSTNAAGNRTLMYGDLAEFPVAAPNRSDSLGSGSSKKQSMAQSEQRRNGNSPKRSAPPGLIVEKPTSSGEVSREQFDFVWNQYQQLSRTMQEALQQRTTELAG